MNSDYQLGLQRLKMFAENNSREYEIIPKLKTVEIYLRGIKFKNKNYPGFGLEIPKENLIHLANTNTLKGNIFSDPLAKEYKVPFSSNLEQLSEALSSHKWDGHWQEWQNVTQKLDEANLFEAVTGNALIAGGLEIRLQYKAGFWNLKFGNTGKIIKIKDAGDLELVLLNSLAKSL